MTAAFLCFCVLTDSAVHITANAGKEDDENGRHAESPDSQCPEDGNPAVRPRHWHLLSQPEGGHGDERHHGRTDSAEQCGHDAIVLKLVEEHGNEQDDEKRGQGGGKGGREGSAVFVELIAHEGADVHGENTGTALSDGYQVEQLFAVNPMVAVHHLRLDDGNHGIATAEGDYANLKEGSEQFKVHSAQFLASSHLRALTKASIQGVTSSAWRLPGYQAHCQGKMARSRWGIMARWRPSAEQMPATL